MQIPELIKKHNGFDAFNPMQEKALASGLLEKNMVVSAPTASGKTVLAELAALNCILNRRKKVVYTCPLRALASEHSHDFKEKYAQELNIRPVLSTGDLDSSGANLLRKDIIYTTFEKLNSLINHKTEWLCEIGLLVVDEIHTIGSDRGPTMEMLITKLRLLNKDIQILGLSATIPNSKELAEWLGAKLVQSDYRPIKLKEGVFCDGVVDYGNHADEIALKDDALCSIAIDTLAKGKQALVFVNTRKLSESTAKKLAEITEKKLTESEKTVLAKASQRILNVLEIPTVQCRTVSELVKRGTCFHNAGLMGRQRTIIEDLFKKNYLKFICSTPTLAQGINMPAFRVVIQSPYRYGDYGMERIPVSEYKQMAGRAGRPKYDTSGEAMLIAKTEFEQGDYLNYYVQGTPEDANSKLGSEMQLRFHLLSAIATGFIFDQESAEKFFSKTLYAHQSQDLSALYRIMSSIVKNLEAMGFVKTTEERIDATPLGRRVAELYLDPVSAFRIITALQAKKLRDLSYLFTISSALEFRPLLGVSKGKEAELWERIQEDKGLLPVNVDVEMFSDNELLQKYWTSYMLKDWIEEVREQEIVDTYKVQPGILRAKLQNADWLAYSCLELSKILELQEHFAPLNKMRKRLQSGILEELIPICELRGIGRARGRRLYNAGVKGIADVKSTDIKDLEKVLGQKVAVSVKAQLDLKK